MTMSRTLIPATMWWRWQQKAGYSTWWISNQGKLGEHDTRISVIASDAEHATFLKKGSFASRKTDDKLLLQETERALADTSSPKIIFPAHDGFSSKSV